MDELAELGFDSRFEEQMRAPGAVRGVPARIVAEHREQYEVRSAAGAGPARLAGRLVHELEDEAYPGVGDWVVLREPHDPDGTSVIDGVLERRTVFLRGAAGREARPQVIAANVDLVFVVCGLDADYSVHRIERYLARIWSSGARPAVILNKSDVCDESAARQAEVEARAPGVPVLVASARRAEGVDRIRPMILPGTTAALVGSSGVGKSTLVNALLGETRMQTGEVRASDGRGRHVTTHRQIVPLPGGGLLLDTPGMRELQLPDESGLDAVFPEIDEHAAGCKYRDCRHDTEPGCAVRAAVEAGLLPADRLEHYRKLEREARAYELRHDEHQRRKTERVWGQLHREADRMRRFKRGE